MPTITAVAPDDHTPMRLRVLLYALTRYTKAVRNGQLFRAAFWRGFFRASSR